MSKLLIRFRSARDDERGQALVIAVLAAFLMLMMAGYVIDYAAAYTKHVQVQNAVDAASLAAANCLATGAPGNTCTSQTDTTSAIGVATTIAAANGVTIQPSQVSINTSSDKVSITGSGSLAGTLPFGVNSQTRVETASSSASYQAAEPCANGDVGTDNCIAVFSGGLNGAAKCLAPTSHLWGLYYTYNFGSGIGYGINVTAAISSFNGALVSDSDVEVADLFGSNGGLFYGSASNCEGWYPSFLSSFGLWGDSTSGTQLPAYQPYPQSWTAGTNASGVTTLTPNTAATPLTCTYTVSGGTVTPAIPSNSGFYASVSGNTLTLTSLAITATIPSGVYCDPNGTIQFAGLGFTGTSYATLYASSISGLALGVSLSPCTSAYNSSCPSSNSLLMYESGTTTLTIGSAADHLNGTIYVPNAILEADSLGTSYGFLEGATVNITAALSLFGNGPEISSLGTTVNVDSLSGG